MRLTKFHPNWTTVTASYRFFKMAATASKIYFWFPVWWRLALEKVKDYPCSIFRQDIFNLRLRYYCNRFLETNGRHFENLNLLSVLTNSPSSACGSALCYQISSERDIRRQIYDVISIFHDGIRRRGVEIIVPVSCLVTYCTCEGHRLSAY